MDDKVKHKLRVGDVFLEEDGWGRVVMKAALSSNIYKWSYIKPHTMCPTDDYRTLEEMEINPTWKFMYNLCDMFADAKKALDEDTST
jgi:hypothetical protein